jgi:phosphohistidine swiveling domain-containing protein
MSIAPNRVEVPRELHPNCRRIAAVVHADRTIVSIAVSVFDLHRGMPTLASVAVDAALA